MRHIDIEYTGSDAVMDDEVFDALVDLFKSFGLTIESAADGPVADTAAA